MGTGASRMSEPFPAENSEVDPATGIPLSLKRLSADATVLPMSKHRPVLLR